MKKRLIACIFICVIALTFTVPVLATDFAVTEPVNLVTEQGYEEITPFHEVTKIYIRTYGGVLQFRIWGVTSGRWLTPWLPV